MATWHQRRNPVLLYHATLWTVVSDPPNDCRGCMLFPTKESAEAYLDRLKALGKAEYSYILAPPKKENK
jgi:hypothetical protein